MITFWGKDYNRLGDAAIAQSISSAPSILLPPAGSSPKHTIYTFINLLKLINVEKMKINKKRPALADFFKKYYNGHLNFRNYLSDGYTTSNKLRS